MNKSLLIKIVRSLKGINQVLHQFWLAVRYVMKIVALLIIISALLQPESSKKIANELLAHIEQVIAKAA